MFGLKETHSLRLSTQQDLLQANTHIQSNKDLFLNSVVRFTRFPKILFPVEFSFYIAQTQMMHTCNYKHPALKREQVENNLILF